MRRHSGVDIIADVRGEASLAAADFAEDTPFAHGTTPDAHAGADLSPASKAEAERRKSRHVAMRVDDDLDHERAALVVRDAETVLAGIEPARARVRAAIDPD